MGVAPERGRSPRWRILATLAGVPGPIAYLWKFLLVLWALPYSLAGLLIGLVGLASGGKAQIRRGALEFYGGAVAAFLGRMPIEAMAMTLGHVILGRTSRALDITRSHEHVHVRQYERWGPLFGPAYLLCSLVLKLRGRDAYRENPFEREAYEKE
jgi:hypothetical protein